MTPTTPPSQPMRTEIMTVRLTDHNKAIAAILSRLSALEAQNEQLRGALAEAERVIRWAAQESAGRVDKSVVGGWLHHADKAALSLAATQPTKAGKP